MRRAMVLVGLATMIGCGGGGGTSTSTQILSTFRSVTTPYMAQDLWSGPECYDAAVFLTVPAVYACRTRNTEMLTGFRDMFARMLTETTELPSTVDLHRIQFAYFLALYIGEASRNDQQWAIPAGMPAYVSREFKRLWNQTPAWQWDAPAFAGGVQEKVTWKLAQGPTSRTYYRAINDDEMFTLCAGAELADYARRTLDLIADLPEFEAATNLGVAAVRTRGQNTSEGGWLFNQGLWDQHSDYAYSDYTEAPTANIPRAKVNVAEDQSHSNRWGAWLTSLAAGSLDSSVAAEMRTTRARLGWQIANRVLAPSSGTIRVRFNNYMDGWNGVYRWNYPTQGPGRGFLPYDLSGTPYIGWWGLIGGSAMGNLHERMARQFPLSVEEEQLYSYETTRYRNPLITDPASYQNGFRWMLCAMGAELARDLGARQQARGQSHRAVR